MLSGWLVEPEASAAMAFKLHAGEQLIRAIALGQLLGDVTIKRASME